jgi:hypothetical protein
MRRPSKTGNISNFNFYYNMENDTEIELQNTLYHYAEQIRGYLSSPAPSLFREKISTAVVSGLFFTCDGKGY